MSDMASIELTPSQRTILSALVNLYNEDEGVIKGEAIAAEIDRNPGTIRNQMQSLKALQLVEGVPGPKGGYKPTPTAFEVLELERMDDPAEVGLEHNGERLADLNVTEINLTSVHHPTLCRAEIQLRGSMRSIHEGDTITVGPTPLAKLEITGLVDGKDESNNILILRIKDMVAPAEGGTH